MKKYKTKSKDFTEKIVILQIYQRMDFKKTGSFSIVKIIEMN